jgi:hypothetical protein
MPLVAPPGAEATVRSAALGSMADVAKSIAEIRETAAPRGEPIDVIFPYRDAGLSEAPDREVDRHEAAIAELESIGVTWVAVSSHTRSIEATCAYLETFGKTYLAR